jgi:hypothetical protein
VDCLSTGPPSAALGMRAGEVLALYSFGLSRVGDVDGHGT